MRRFLYSIMSNDRKDWVALLVRIPLFVLSLFYGIIVRTLLMCYSSGLLPRRKLNVPVISVGNLTMGGVGKTPVVILIAQMLRLRKLKVVVLTRGYKPGFSDRGSDQADEAQVLSEVLVDVPVVVNSDRYLGGIEAIKNYQPDVIILDDGFQHWRFSRDLEIVLVDSVNPFGNGHLLPMGILREPVSSLKRADVLVLTKTDRADVPELKNQLDRLVQGVPVVETVHKPKSLFNFYTHKDVSMNQLCRPVVAFCGVGDPLSFKAMLVSLGSDVKEFISFMDHHSYDSEDMKKIRGICDDLGIRTVVTTRKDAVKLQKFEEVWRGYDLLNLNIEIEITRGQNEFENRINHVLRG
jgi:tetraacyldisaccharide 4'-kinase